MKKHVANVLNATLGLLFVVAVLISGITLLGYFSGPVEPDPEDIGLPRLSWLCMGMMLLVVTRIPYRLRTRSQWALGLWGAALFFWATHYRWPVEWVTLPLDGLLFIIFWLYGPVLPRSVIRIGWKGSSPWEDVDRIAVARAGKTFWHYTAAMLTVIGFIHVANKSYWAIFRGLRLFLK